VYVRTVMLSWDPIFLAAGALTATIDIPVLNDGVVAPDATLLITLATSATYQIPVGHGAASTIIAPMTRRPT